MNWRLITGHPLAPIRLTNAATLFLPVLPTPLRGYCFAVRQNERQLPFGSGETQGEGVSLHFFRSMKLDGVLQLSRLFAIEARIGT